MTNCQTATVVRIWKKTKQSFLSAILLMSLLAVFVIPATSVAFQPLGNADVLPLPLAPFKGTIGKSLKDSKGYFAPLGQSPKDAPNIVLIMLDDVGFGHSSAFGGPVPTPALEQLARQGLRYNNFFTTGMCSPTRAALLTGRNHHRTGSGPTPEGGTAFPGYNGMWGKDAASIAEILRQYGYSTAMFGKWHNTPTWEAGPAGPFDRWPTGMGFDYFYGFIGGDTNQFEPALYENTVPVDKPFKEGYTLNSDLANHAIRWMHQVNLTVPDKPFFLYLAPGATHAPLQAPKEWIDRFKGKFDYGWDRQRERTFENQKAMGVIPQDAKLAPRPTELRAWDSFSPEEQRVMARMQEVYAGYLAQTDYEVGRVLNSIESSGRADNTLVIYIVGDNGPSAEGSLVGTFNEMIPINGVTSEMKDNFVHIDDLGGPLSYGHYPVEWAWAGSTPFQYFKRVPSHMGAIRNGMVVSWPRAIKDPGDIRTQFHHVIDIVPTVLDAIGVPAPKQVNGVKQMSMDGVSMKYSFADATAPSNHSTQYFEIMDKRGIYHDGWWAGAVHGDMPWNLRSPVSEDFDHDAWELEDLHTDFSQTVNLATKNPKKLAEMKQLFDREARRNNVYPLIAGFGPHVIAARNLLPSNKTAETRFTLYPGDVRLREGVAPNVLNKSHRITVEIGASKSGRPDGMLITQGGRFGGFALYVRDGHLVYVYNRLGLERFRIASDMRIPNEPVQVSFDFARDAGPPGTGGVGRLYIGSQLAGEGRILRTTPWIMSLDETMDVGEDHGTPVDESYQVPFPFNDNLQKVTIEIRGSGEAVVPSKIQSAD